MEPVGEQIRAELSRVGADSGAGDAVTAWPSAVGEEIARNAWPARTQPDGTLVVHVRDAIWGFELTQRASEISERLPGRPRLRFTRGRCRTTPEGPPSPRVEFPQSTLVRRQRSPPGSRIETCANLLRKP